MTRFLGPYGGVVYSVMRIVFAFLYLSHGLKWLFGAFGGRPVPIDFAFYQILGLKITPLTAGVIELICGVLMVAGLFTSWAAFIASGEMASAYFIAHVPRGGFVSIVNGSEITVALCFGFLYLATQGDGPISIGALLGSKTAQPVAVRR